ncbi:MAG: hypothetical protein M1834_001677 [Cirrosporium novae-zelandiae]|nr:MAG: hypothetical protein M1834_001677 [Cirrosporium novae-zelandiae]
MKSTLQDRLWRRELGSSQVYSSPKAIYGDRALVEELDIVNELGGHSGCVNALSWSRSGRLLASGSDDERLNIYTYQPEHTLAPFALSTSVTTGHSANIFSVKFMPFSNDATLVTCAGDSEVRVFDIEHSSSSVTNTYNGTRYLSEGDTNARVYRSHSDRVKRIVTESSPYVFLTCSEDGEVRQWDLRQPSSAYPAPRSHYVVSRSSRDLDNSNIPPPLISYKRYRLDLNTISCSPSQPYYIALGGAHLHCLLHDRRMLGRDTLEERGMPSPINPSVDGRDDIAMSQATRCVRRFAPNGRKRMKRRDNGHITSCKISDYNPNEMIVSWSGDWIYSFDLVRSPDALESSKEETLPRKKSKRSKAFQDSDRKRKRGKKESPTSGNGTERAGPRPKQTIRHDTEGSVPLRVDCENGETEDLPGGAELEPPNHLYDYLMNEVMERGDAIVISDHIAMGVMRIRKYLFSMSGLQNAPSGIQPGADYSAYISYFNTALSLAASAVPRMDEINRNWRYPVNPDVEELDLQQELRGDREASRRFVQAAGTLARFLGGNIITVGGDSSVSLRYCQQIVPAPNEEHLMDSTSQFRYDFLKAILLWLEGGQQALLQGFKRPPDQRISSPRFPIPEDAGMSAIDDILIPYLLRLAGSQRIVDVDASRFERDEYRVVFESETAAVIAFSHAIRIPLDDLSTAVVPATDSSSSTFESSQQFSAQDKRTAARFWGFKVARGVLLNAGAGINYALVDKAFGGLGIENVDIGERSQADIDPNEDITVAEWNRRQMIRAGVVFPSASLTEEQSPVAQAGDEQIGSGTDQKSHPVPEDPSSEEQEDLPMRDVDEEQEDSDDDVDDDGDADSSDEDDHDEEDSETGERDALEGAFAAFFSREPTMYQNSPRDRLEEDVPCSSHTRTYRGHCNVQTVKDVNFYGLQDEYVVSGSDGGHLFIWDKKTTELVSILEGDGEVVNVVQGEATISLPVVTHRALVFINHHRYILAKPFSITTLKTILIFDVHCHPYEPMIAASGIDHTIKIFSADNRAQDAARAGLNLARPATTAGFSNFRAMRSRRISSSNENAPVVQPDTPGEGLRSRKRIDQAYQITNQNDVNREGGNSDAFIAVRGDPIREVRLVRVPVAFAEWIMVLTGGEDHDHTNDDDSNNNNNNYHNHRNPDSNDGDYHDHDDNSD